MNLNRFGQTVRLAVVGLSCRGTSQIRVLLDMPDVEITSVCDVYPDRVEAACQTIKDARGKEPFHTLDYAECIDRPDVDAAIIMTSWETHIPIAIFAIRHGKRAAIEVGGADSVDACWQLVHASEETGLPVMMLENCCYGDREMALLNMIRQNLFGTLVHCAGSYAHDLRDEIGLGDINRHYRQRHFLHRNAELYPTHELGPIATFLRINHGNRMTMLTSMASKASGLHEWLQKNRPDTELASAQVNEGDVVTTMIRCANGETILLTHDCTLPRAYSRGGVVRGTQGMWMEDGRSIYIEGRSPETPGYWTHRFESDEKYMEEYRHPLWRQYNEIGVRGGHDGMDYLVLRAFIESVQNQTEPPIDVYDTAAWMSITALSESSIAMGSMPVPIPDFTNGRWYNQRKNPAREEFEF